MSNHVIVNAAQHSDIRIDTTYSELNGDGYMLAMTFPAEFRNIQAHYPIVFQKNIQTGEFFPMALFGFQEGENLFLSSDSSNGWDAQYIPINLQRQPFMIGIQNQKPIVTLDMDSPKVNTIDGEQLFLGEGQHSDYFNSIIKMLNQLNAGVEQNKAYAKTLLDFDLLEPFELSYSLKNKSKFKLSGFYTIHEENLAALNDEQLVGLNQQGLLQPTYMVLASMSRLSPLLERKNTQGLT